MKSKLLFIGLLGLILILMGCTQAGGEQAGKAGFSKTTTKPVVIPDSCTATANKVTGVQNGKSFEYAKSVCSSNTAITYSCKGTLLIQNTKIYCAALGKVCSNGACIAGPDVSAFTSDGQSGNKLAILFGNGVDNTPILLANDPNNGFGVNLVPGTVLLKLDGNAGEWILAQQLQVNNRKLEDFSYRTPGSATTNMIEAGNNFQSWIEINKQ